MNVRVGLVLVWDLAVQDSESELSQGSIPRESTLGGKVCIPLEHMAVGVFGPGLVILMIKGHRYIPCASRVSRPVVRPFLAVETDGCR